MKKSTIVVLSFAMLWLSCSPRKVLMSSSTTDSVASSTEKVYIERLRIDTVFIDLPGASVERIVQDSASYIEKDNVRSTARINANGTLYHDLFIDAIKKAIPVKVTDTENKETTTEKANGSISIEVPVKLPLTWREDFWCTSGKVGWGILSALSVLLIYKIIRK